MVKLAGLPVIPLRSLPSVPAGAKRTSIPISLMSAALADDAEQRHAVGIMRAAQEIVDQARNEDGLAGAAQARHREPDGRAAGKLAEIEPLGCLGEDRRQPAQIHERGHLKSHGAPAFSRGTGAPGGGLKIGLSQVDSGGGPRGAAYRKVAHARPSRS